MCLENRGETKRPINSPISTEISMVNQKNIKTNITDSIFHRKLKIEQQETHKNQEVNLNAP